MKDNTFVLYSFKLEDGAFWTPYCAKDEKYCAMAISKFYREVGEDNFAKGDWYILGHYNMFDGTITPFEKPELLDWKKVLDEVEAEILDNSSILKGELDEKGGKHE